MSRGWIGLACAIVVGSLAVGCDDGGDPDPADAGVDAFMGCTPLGELALADAGPPPASPTCTAPDGGTVGMGACCFQDSQADATAAPELRLRFLDVLAPQGSPLMSTLLLGVLNDALAMNTFAWLIRVEGADADGDVNVVTGFGLTNADGTYSFPDGTSADPLDLPEYAPAMIPGTITGEYVRTERHSGSLTVPVLNTEGTDVQLELVLRNIQVIDSVFNSDRSCVGFAASRGRFETGAILDGFIEVESARTGMVVSGPVMTTVCAAIAGDLTDAMYCEQPQSAWETPPDSFCDASGCTANISCEEDVCDREGESTTLPACNAWRLVAEFAAQGVDITD
jgi:hypothetical protein